MLEKQKESKRKKSFMSPATKPNDTRKTAKRMSQRFLSEKWKLNNFSIPSDFDKNKESLE